MANDPKDSWEPAARRYHDIERETTDPIDRFIWQIKDIVLGAEEPIQTDFALEA